MHISGIGSKLTNQRGHTCKLGAKREEGDEGEKKVKERDKMVQKRQRRQATEDLQGGRCENPDLRRSKETLDLITVTQESKLSWQLAQQKKNNSSNKQRGERRMRKG